MATCGKSLPSDAVRAHNTKGIHPCGLVALTSVGGVNVAAEALCFLHWTMKHGHKDVVLPVV